MPDIGRRDELALLDVDDASGLAGLDQDIGLTAQECGNLQNVYRLGRERSLARLVNVREDRDATIANPFQDAQSFFDPRPTIGIYTRPIGLIERRLEYERHIQRIGQTRERRGEHVDVFFALDHARSGDQCQRPAAADFDCWSNAHYCRMIDARPGAACARLSG